MTEKKPLSEARKRANKKWDEKNLKRISLALSVKEYDDMKEHITKTGEKQNQFIRQSIKEKIERDKQ